VSHERGELIDMHMRDHAQDCCDELAHLRKGSLAASRALSLAQSVARDETEVITAYVSEALDRRKRLQNLTKEFQMLHEVSQRLEVSVNEKRLRAQIHAKDQEISNLKMRLDQLNAQPCLSKGSRHYAGRPQEPITGSSLDVCRTSTRRVAKEPTPELLRLREETRALALRVQAARCGSRAVAAQMGEGLTA
jgi:hypothetical protein